MPYIDECSRKFWDSKSQTLIDSIHKDVEPGVLNYLITKLLTKWVKDKLKYVSICMVMGTLFCVAMEFYRRVAGPYEDRKIKENGDVY